MEEGVLKVFTEEGVLKVFTAFRRDWQHLPCLKSLESGFHVIYVDGKFGTLLCTPLGSPSSPIYLAVRR